MPRAPGSQWIARTRTVVDSTRPGVPPEGHRAVVVQPDGKILAAGGLCEYGAPPLVFCSLGLVRYADHAQLCGDVDDDARVTVTDGVTILRRAAELPG